LPFIEGDAFHAPASVAKMQAGQPLTDADRAGWLARLAEELAARPAGTVLSCSALCAPTVTACGRPCPSCASPTWN
jgi:gluconokinase